MTETWVFLVLYSGDRVLRNNMDRHLETRHGISRKRKVASRRKAYDSHRQRYGVFFFPCSLFSEFIANDDLQLIFHYTSRLTLIILSTDVNDLMLATDTFRSYNDT